MWLGTNHVRVRVGSLVWKGGSTDGDGEPIQSNGVADGVASITPTNTWVQPTSTFSIAGYFTANA